MKLRPRSVRLRMSLYYACALAAMLLVFSLGIYFIVEKALTREAEQGLEKDLAAVRNSFSRDPDELEELEEMGTVGLFCITTGDRIVYRSMPWGRAGLPVRFPAAGSGSLVSWTSPEGRPYFVMAGSLSAEGEDFRIFAARNARIMKESLRALAATLALALPLGVLLALAGGYLLAGRMLSPLAAMAKKAARISAEHLSERLPVENPHDEFGRLASVFNETLSRLEESFDRLRRFTADASHELRTPLTALKSVGEVGVGEERDPEQYRDVIGSMLEEADRLAQLVDALLVLTRADTGGMPAGGEPVDLGLLAEDVAECLRVLADDKKQELVVEKGEPRATVEGDRSALRSVVMNLLDNAIKYTPEGGRIRVAVRRDPDGTAVLEVRDDGPGIPPDLHGKVFDRFFRVGRGAGGRRGGAGLGLSIARRIVERHRGRIEVESEPGRGSTFRVKLPRGRLGGKG